MSILLLNSFFYILFFFYLFKRDRFKLTVHSFLISLYAIVAVMGVITFGNGIYEDVFGNQDESTLSIIPYILCFLAVYIMTRPLAGLTSDSCLTFTRQSVNEKIEKYLIYGGFILLIAQVVMFQYAKVRFYGEGLNFADLYINNAVEGEKVASNFNNQFLNFLYSKLVAFNSVFACIFYTILFNQLVSNRNVIINFFLIVLLFSLNIYIEIFSANRGGIFFNTMMLVSYYIFFRNSIRHALRKLFYISLGVGICILTFYVLSITYARAGDTNQESINNLVYRYFGEPFPNLGFQIWNEQNINHPYGKRFFPVLSETSDNYISARRDRTDYWARYVGIPMHNFKTLFGDLYVEFGVIYGIFFILIISWLYYRFFIKRIYTIFDLSLVFYYVNACIMGLFVCYWGGGELIWKRFFYLIILVKILNKLSVKNESFTNRVSSKNSKIRI